MWLLAIKAMLGDRGKLLTSLLGIAFSVVLVNLQGGLLLGMIQKASLLVDYGQADIWVGHQHMSNVDMGTFIPERWIYRIRGVEGVERVEPYVVAFGQVTMPDGRFENVVMVGSEPASLLGNASVMADGDPRAVRHPDGVLVDVCDLSRLGNPRIGDIREISGRRARIVGMTRGIVGFTTNPYVFTTLDRVRHGYAAGVPADVCSYFLVKAKPGVDPKVLCKRIRERVPSLDVYDRSTYSWMCMQFWLTRTGLGISFGLAAFLGLLVGLAVVAQTLYASVNERIKEFGTLKAMGANDPCISQFLLAQAMGAAFLGSLVGLSCAVLIGRLLSTPRAPVMLTASVAVGSVALIVLVCLLAAWLPYWRIRCIDPASVLRS
jgi:putative ABC transport system permease protein